MQKIQNPVKGARLLKYPVGNIYQFFGENIELYRKAIGTEGHNGIDIVSAFRTPILATAGKIVEVKNDSSGYGKWIRLLTPPDVNGDFLELTYGHLDETLVNLGEEVKDGQEIGKMGNTGFVISGNTPYWGNAPAGKGVHLHFGARECSVINTGWQSVYASGDKVYIKNYQNGFKGSVNPLKFIEVNADLAAYFWGLLESIRMKLLEIKGRKVN